MSDVRRDSTSFGDPNARPPTPQQTPTSASFASLIFETPQQPHGSFTDLGGSTPRFAEEYSVFNATPGNLRGSQSQISDVVPSTPVNTHKRLLSTEGFALEIATHANHFSPNPNLPPVDLSKRLASSSSLKNTRNTARETTPISTPSLTKARSTKKPRRGTITKDPESQIISPPPTVHKGEQKLAPKLIMQYEQSFHQPDFTEAPQPHDIATLMANSGDMFHYPLSAPTAATANFWDPQASMGMDLDFNTADPGMFPSSGTGHRQTGSFDWNNIVQLFQDPGMLPPSSDQENVQPQQSANLSMNQDTQQLDDPFAMVNNGELVDPNLMMDQNGAMPAFAAAEQAIPAPGVPARKTTSKPELSRVANKKSTSTAKVPDRKLANSPLKHPRNALQPPAGDSQGRGKLLRSNTLPTLAPAARSMAQDAGVSADGGRPMARPSERLSPVKNQRRLSFLASIRETSPAVQRASVRFTIDARGRARAETTMVSQSSMTQSLLRSKSSRELPSRSTWAASSDDESEDADPIIIPSRTNSFSASFALPDPRKPVGSIFHRSRRSTSDRSSSSADGEIGHPHGDDSVPRPPTGLAPSSSGYSPSTLYSCTFARPGSASTPTTRSSSYHTCT